MNPNDKVELTKILVVMGEFYKKKITDGMIDIYFSTLEKYNIKQINDAINKHIKNTETGMFFPLVAHIILQIEGNDDGMAISAWGMARKAMSKHGAWYSVVFEDKTIMAVIDRMGGWIEFCGMLEKEMGYKEHEFIQFYKRYKDFPEQAPKVLIGTIEQSNRFGGFLKDIPKPKMIGTEHKQLTGGGK